MRSDARSRKARAKWRKLVKEQEQSGQSVAAFCRQRGLCGPHFFAWKKRLRSAGEPLQKFVEVKLATAAPVASTAADSRVEVVLRNGRSLRVRAGFDAALVRALIAVVEGAA